MKMFPSYPRLHFLQLVIFVSHSREGRGSLSRKNTEIIHLIVNFMLPEWCDELLLGSSQDRTILLSSVSTWYTLPQ